VQRLFSTFADGWPGVGILLLRLLTSLALICFGIANAQEVPTVVIGALQMIGVIAGIFILVGLWTPVVGTVVTVVQLWIAFARYSYHYHFGDLWIPVIQAILGAALAMIGPGAWSIDARLFRSEAHRSLRTLATVFSPNSRSHRYPQSW
jgi:putative oxidoreductase